MVQLVDSEILFVKFKLQLGGLGNAPAHLLTTGCHCTKVYFFNTLGICGAKGAPLPRLCFTQLAFLFKTCIFYVV